MRYRNARYVPIRTAVTHAETLSAAIETALTEAFPEWKKDQADIERAIEQLVSTGDLKNQAKDVYESVVYWLREVAMWLQQLDDQVASDPYGALLTSFDTARLLEQYVPQADAIIKNNQAYAQQFAQSVVAAIRELAAGQGAAQ